jgi:hypothetical protein
VAGARRTSHKAQNGYGVKGTVRASTLDRYRYAIGPHIKPAVGRMKLTPAHVRGF